MLSAGRGYYDGFPQPIQISEMITFLHTGAVPGIEIEIFIDYMQGLDSEFIAHAQEQRDQQTRKRGKK